MKIKFAEKSKKANSKRHVGTEIKSAQGITLIALVITIVVMIILAGLAINLTLGDNGILTKASEAKVETTHAQVKDAIILAYSEYQIELQTGSKEKEISKIASIKIVKMEQNETEKWSNFMQFLTEKEYIDEAGIINTEKLLGKKASLGNGTSETDVYKIVQQDNYYVLNYYDQSSNVRELWKVEIGEMEH